MYRNLTALLLGCLTGGLLVAEDLTVRGLALNNKPLPELFVKTKDGFESLEFSDIQPAKPLEIPAVNPLPIFESNDPENATAAAHQVKLPDSPGVLLLGWMDGKTPRFAALPDDVAAAGPLDWLVINATPEPVAIQVGENSQPFSVKPGTSLTKRVSPPEEHATAFKAVRSVDGKPVVFYSTYLPFREDVRSVLLVYPDGKHLRVKQMFDMTLVDEDEES